MKSTKTISTNDIKLNFKAILNKLGAALMFPLSFLAFVSVFLGISYLFPVDFFLRNFISKISIPFFSVFPLLIFISLINVYHNNKNEQTIIKSLIFFLTFYAFILIVETRINKSINISIFTSMILATIFILLDKKRIHLSLWVLIAFGLAFIFVPIFIFINITISFIGLIINGLPIGINAFLYGFINRLLLPFGLHSVMIPTFGWTSIGGELNIYNTSGELVKTIAGDSPIWMFMYSNGIKDFADVGNFIVDGTQYSFILRGNTAVGQYQEGFIPIISFAYPMVALTYWFFNRDEKSKVLLLGVLVTMFSGITETTEYFFILINPWLYLLNAVMVGLSFMLCNILNAHVWLSTGWIIDILLFGIIPWIKGFQTNWYWLIVIGLIVGSLYSTLFILIDKYTKYEIK